MTRYAMYLTKDGAQAVANAYAPQTQAALARELDFLPPLYDPQGLEARRDDLRRVECLFSTWGMFAMTEAQIRDYLPNLKAVFYAAGSVQQFAAPFLRCGVRVFCAAAANAQPVAEFTASLILLANKGYLRAVRFPAGGWDAAQAVTKSYPGNYRCKVGLLGAGAIGRRVIARLRESDVALMVFDPFLPDAQAAALGVEKAGLEEIFAQCQTISNHLANNAQTRGMLTYSLFSKMKKNATFLNTGRGAQVVEADLVRAMREQPGRTALLDVTDPEPPAAGSPLYTTPNIFLTPHIAGSLSQEISRMGLYMQRAFEAYQKGTPASCEVVAGMLKTMA